MTTGTDAISSAPRILHAQAMAPEEIRAVIGAADPETVHRYLELHRERLEEQLAEQCRLLVDLERSLMEAIDRRSAGDQPGSPRPPERAHPGIGHRELMRRKSLGRSDKMKGSRLVRGITVAAALSFVGFGLWALLSPGGFYDSIALWPPFNEHFIHDVGAFQVGIGATLIAALVWTDALFVALLGSSVGAVLHEAAHIADRDLGGRDSDPVVLGFLAVALVAATVARGSRVRS